ncbi:uncharacterized protein LOC134451788 [Engraulis encrasicolus]|uniref:uncharacterized protein LOC134451788 n=1 Tax=Engraulis encrasicolus TaxID=184585 RepID=UPI002FD4BD91
MRTDIDGCEDVRRWTFGVRSSSRPVKNILVVGETGTGKTTFINTLVNYLLGVQWGDNIWFQITQEDKEKSQAKSQTTAITVYEVFAESSSLRIIDTPGYGSTDGIDFDQMVAENLHRLFRSEDGIHEISAVGLVVKSGQNRLTDFQRYIFDAVLSLFGKDIEKNIAVLITHSDGMPEDDVISALKEADVPCAKDVNGEPVHFQFNNRQSKDHKEKEKKKYQEAWERGYCSLERFMIFLEKADVKELSMTEKVLRERKRLEACVNNIQDAIRMEELKQNQLQQTQRALEENIEKMGRNENFTYEVEEPFKQLEPINLPWRYLTKKATCCTRCEENCHYPGCWWVKDLAWCSAMKNNRCTVCTRRCPVSDHVKHNKIYVPRIRKVKKTAHDLLKQYNKQVDIQNALQEELFKSEATKKTLLLQAYQCIVQLEEIALKKDSMSTLIHLDFLIEKMNELGDGEKVEKLVHLNEKYQAANRSRWVWWVPERLRKVQEKVSTFLVSSDHSA